MIQDIAPHKLNNHYDPLMTADENSYVMCFHGASLWMCTVGENHIPRLGELEHKPELTYLFSVDGKKYFLSMADAVPKAEHALVPVNQLREKGTLPRHVLYAVMTGKHLSDWYTDNRFCGKCGARRVHSDTERCMVCPECGNHSYPRIMPAVIVGVINGDSLLLTRYRRGYSHNALIAGFTEIGETVEETVAREVMEESGLRVKNIRYYKSQPWGVANDILLGYYCEVDGDDQIRMDEGELRYAAWVPRQEIVLQPDDISLTNEMMLMFKRGEIKAE